MTSAQRHHVQCEMPETAERSTLIGHDSIAFLDCNRILDVVCLQDVFQGNRLVEMALTWH
jgi:hypothetical protein